LTLLSIFVLYVQLFLGGMFRHHGLSWWPASGSLLATAGVRGSSTMGILDLFRKNKDEVHGARALVCAVDSRFDDLLKEDSEI